MKQRSLITLFLCLGLGLVPLLLGSCSSAPTTMGMGQKIYLKSMLPSLKGNEHGDQGADSEATESDSPQP